MDTFTQLMTEFSSKDATSLYQTISGSYERFKSYRKEGTNIFTRLPGQIGLLALSGSYTLIFLGMLYEFTITKLIYRKYVYISLICASLANFRLRYNTQDYLLYTC